MCRYVCLTEVAATSTEVGLKIYMNITNQLLGHKNEDSVCTTAQELDWTLMHSIMHAWEHCAKSMAKQKNVKKTSIAKKATVLGQSTWICSS